MSLSFRVQIAVFGAVLVGVALLVFSLLVYGLASLGIQSGQDRDLTLRSERAANYLATAGAEAFAVQHAIATVDLTDSNDSFVELLDAGGRVLSSTATLNGAPPRISVAGDPPRSTLTTVDVETGLATRVSIRAWSRPDLGLSGYVVVGQTIKGAQASLAGVRGFLWISGLFTFAAALAAIWLVAGRALRPLQLVASTAEDIRLTGDLTRRLPESRGWVELNRLARAFNGMLARLEQAQARLASALDAQRRFVADASHELRTPLTSIRTNAGLLLGRTDVSAEDQHSALSDIASEAERMSRLVHDLLTLARADAGQHLERGRLDLAPLVAEVGRQAQQLYADRRIEVATCPSCVSGSADALRQLQWILLDNAARLAGPGGRVSLSVAAGDGFTELSVTDDGPGVREADRERIFERFFQADMSRTGGGAGLGLSIARWIVTEHGGTITVGDNPAGRGAKFVAAFPVLSAEC